MTTIMNQVTCSLCDIKMDELEWMYHIVSENHLQLCEVCKMSYSTSEPVYHNPPDKGYKHLETDFHKRNLFRSRYIFK